ncbi:MAG: YciI family protein [Anaerolineae bacterium]|nr:YciI family protein [Anaerolineae bacterium]
MKTFFIRHIPGPAWIEGKGFHEQPLREHGNYINSLHKQGILLEGGPFLDNEGGLAIIQVENEEQAQKIVAEDPAITSGVFTAELHPWLRVDWESYGTGAKD